MNQYHEPSPIGATAAVGRLSVMGGLIISGRRGDDSYKPLTSSSSPIDQFHDRVSKKPRLSVHDEPYARDNGRLASSSHVVSRISQYPAGRMGFPREVHAPVRNSRLLHFSSIKNIVADAKSKESSTGRMGRFGELLQKCKTVGDYVMLRSLNHFVVEEEVHSGNLQAKEIIEIDNEENGDNLYDDSSVEELKVAGTKGKGGQGAEGKFRDLNVMVMEDKEVRSLDSSVISGVSNLNEKVDDVEKVGLMQSDQESDGSWLPPYKKLFDLTKKRDFKLSRLKFDIELIEQILQKFNLLQPHKKEEELKKNVVEECFVPLTEEEEAEISRAMSYFNRRKILVNHVNSNIDITGGKLQCLRPGAWLNDEVINLYLELLKEREKREPHKFLKCHFFSTFFYKKLISGRGGYSFQSVKRWTTKERLGYNLIDCDKIFVPIHKEVHWCLAIINQKDQKFQYIDSLKGDDTQVLDVLARYFVDEVQDKCGEDIDISSWEQEFFMGHPEQENGFDCGMFMIKYADFYSRDIGLCFSQEHMAYFRLRTAKEILKLRAE